MKATILHLLVSHFNILRLSGPPSDRNDFPTRTAGRATGSAFGAVNVDVDNPMPGHLLV